MKPRAMQSFAARIHELYGDLPERAPVVHVSSAVRGDDGRLHVIRIGPEAPQSERDFFVLQLSRARADAVLTSAEILRREPELTFDFVGPYAEDFRADRARRRQGALTACILTRSGDVPLEHGVWEDSSKKLVFTPVAAADELATRLGTRAEVVGIDALDPAHAIIELRRRRLHAVSIEAGPRTSAALYESHPPVVDELWLSVLEAMPDPRWLGSALSPNLLHGLHCASSVHFDEAGGRFRFERWRRA
jgi:riboflavin biosynthesis pyrimidine reductase